MFSIIKPRPAGNKNLTAAIKPAILMSMPYYNEPGVRYNDPLIRYNDPRTYAQVLADSLNPPHTMPFEVILDLAGLPPDEIATRAIATAEAGLADATLVALHPEFTALKVLAQGYLAADAAYVDAQAECNAALIARDGLAPAVLTAFNTAGTHIGEAVTNEQQIAALHLRTRKENTPRPVPARPANFNCSYGDQPGEVDGQCDAQRGIADFYHVRYATTDPTLPNTVWIQPLTVTKSTFTLTGLPSGVMVWVEMQAANTRGNSPWSDPFSIRVP